VSRLFRATHNVLDELSQQGCGFISLGEAWCDTTSAVGKLMITIMGGIAEFERSLIRARCEEGIERAKAKGTKFGRKRSMTPEQRRVAAARYAKGETQAELAKGLQGFRGDDVEGARVAQHHRV
jgi:DNA invertase Pin-like site-specific DNA recombinase